MISEGGIVTDGAECTSMSSVGLIVKNEPIVVSFWAGHNGYLLWDLIGQLA